LEEELGGNATWAINADKSIDAEWIGGIDLVATYDSEGELTLAGLLEALIKVIGIADDSTNPEGSISIVPRFHGVTDSEHTYRFFRGAIDLATNYWNIYLYPTAVLTAEKIMGNVRKNQSADPFEIAVRFYWSERGVYRARDFGRKRKVRIR